MTFFPETKATLTTDEAAHTMAIVSGVSVGLVFNLKSFKLAYFYISLNIKFRLVWQWSSFSFGSHTYVYATIVSLTDSGNLATILRILTPKTMSDRFLELLTWISVYL